MGKSKSRRNCKNKFYVKNDYSQEIIPNENDNVLSSICLKQKNNISKVNLKTTIQSKEFSSNRVNNNQDFQNCTSSDKKHIHRNSGDIDSCSTSNDEKSVNKKNHEMTAKNDTKQNNKVPFKSNASDFKIKYKTELCKYFEINGYCKYGDNCAYAHGKENLRSKVTNTTAYRTRKCVQFFENGYCPYGSRCQFAHHLESNILNNPYDRKMTYSKILETISKMENVENIKKLIEKPRLPVFQQICENSKGGKSRLL